MERVANHFLDGRDDVDPAAGQWGGERLYYPIGTDMAIIKSPDSQDVLVEGLHSFLMYMVQLNKKEEFDRLWKWAKTYMQYQDGPWKGYFAWKLDAAGNRLGETPASGSEPFIATALFFAAHRWGNGGGIFNYEAEAQAILDTMIHKEEMNGGVINGVKNAFTETPWGPIINFVPYYDAANSTGGSYPTAAFYRLWQLWDSDAGDRQYWARATTAAREFWHRAADPATGLLPERAEFSGAPRAQEGRDYYGHDNWFTHSNISIDYEWFAEDEWEPQEMAKVLRFFATQNPIYDHYTLAGQPFSQYHSNVGHLAAIAGGGIILSSDDSRLFAQRLWDSSPPTGQWRFSTGLLYMMGFMEASGMYRVW